MTWDIDFEAIDDAALLRLLFDQEAAEEDALLLLPGTPDCSIIPNFVFYFELGYKVVLCGSILASIVLISYSQGLDFGFKVSCSYLKHNSFILLTRL